MQKIKTTLRKFLKSLKRFKKTEVKANYQVFFFDEKTSTVEEQYFFIIEDAIKMSKERMCPILIINKSTNVYAYIYTEDENTSSNSN